MNSTELHWKERIHPNGNVSCTANEGDIYLSITTVLHVPSLDLVVSGDVIYNGVHQYLAESASGGLQKWLKAVDVVESVKPLRIVAGHKDKNLDDAGPRAITQTRDYLQSAEELLTTCTTAHEFFDAMSERYPTRLNPTALWMGATALHQ